MLSRLSTLMGAQLGTLMGTPRISQLGTLMGERWAQRLGAVVVIPMEMSRRLPMWMMSPVYSTKCMLERKHWRRLHTCLWPMRSLVRPIFVGRPY